MAYTLEQLQKMGAQPVAPTTAPTPTPAPSATGAGMTFEQLQKMGAQPVSAPAPTPAVPTPVPQEDGLLKTIIKDPIKTLLVKPAARTTEALGRLGVFGTTVKKGFEEMADETQDIKTPFGDYKIEPVKAGMAGIEQTAGEALKAGSYLYGGKGAAEVGKTFLGKRLGTAVAKGAGAGAATGAMYGGGQSMEEGGDIGDVAKGTAAGAAIGAIAGGAIGAASYPISKLLQRGAVKAEQANLLRQGATDSRVAAKTLSPQGKVITEPYSKEAIRQGIPEGDVALIRGGSLSDRAKMLKMLDIRESQLTNKRNMSRATDVVGDSFINSVAKPIESLNRQAAKELDIVAQRLAGQKTNTMPAVESFAADLEKVGVQIGAKGKLNFTGSNYEGLKGTQSLINNVWNRALRVAKSNDALQAHRMKSFIDENVTFGKTGEGLSGKAELMLKSFRRNVDKTLDTQFSAYNNANTVYADTIQELHNLNLAIGRKFKLGDSFVNAQAGTTFRRMISNAQSRAPLLKMMESMQNTAKKYGIKIDDDVITQSLFADTLEKMLGTEAPTSILGQFSRGMETFGSTTSIEGLPQMVSGAGEALRGNMIRGTMKAGSATIDVLRNVSQQNKINALRALLKAEGTGFVRPPTTLGKPPFPPVDSALAKSPTARYTGDMKPIFRQTSKELEQSQKFIGPLPKSELQMTSSELERQFAQETTRPAVPQTKTLPLVKNPEFVQNTINKMNQGKGKQYFQGAFDSKQAGGTINNPEFTQSTINKMHKGSGKSYFQGALDAKEYLALSKEYYHGSANPTEVMKGGFDLEKAGSNSGYKGIFGKGVYITNELDRAELYGKPMKIDVNKAKLWTLKADRVLDELYTKKTNYGDPDMISKLILDKGYDGVRILGKGGVEEIAVMNPKMLKIEAPSMPAVKKIVPAENIQKSKDALKEYNKILADPKSDAMTRSFAQRGIKGEKEYLAERVSEKPKSNLGHQSQETTKAWVDRVVREHNIGEIKGVPKTQSVKSPTLKQFTGYDDLTTKFLNYAKGKTTLSRQEITDFAKRPELKKGEADLLSRLSKDLPEGKLPAQDFADSIRRDLLELKPVKAGKGFRNITIENRGGKSYDTYEEVVFESPIKTNGSSHYPNSEKYFAHARGGGIKENGKKIWEENEIQSDLLQKEGLKKVKQLSDKEFEEVATQSRKAGKSVDEFLDEKIGQLDPFTNDRFGERIMRERIKDKASKGYEKYRLPTGETVGKIEGFSAGNWVGRATDGSVINITPQNIKVGATIIQGGDIAGDMATLMQQPKWVITNILGDGRFKAVPKEMVERFQGNIKEAVAGGNAETFDLTGKSNPQYRRYEQWGKFLKNKFGGKEVTDPQGNSWVEIDLNKEQGRMPIEAFGVFPFALLPSTKEKKKTNFGK